MRSKSASYPLDQSPLFKLRRKRRLAELLGISLPELRKLTKSDGLYREFSQKKADGGVRDIEAPARDLKVVQARLSRLLSRIAAPEYLYCPVKRRSYVTNAAKHRGQRVIRCLDVRKYFPSTSSRRVFWFFRQVLKCEDDVAATLTSLVTYRGHLPTGSPVSPILAYFAHLDVWEAISVICASHGYRLSVYVDDATISGAKLDPKVIWEIKERIHASGLRYHKEKRFIGRAAEVTGVIIDGDKLVVPHRQHRKLFQTRSALRSAEEADERRSLRARTAGLEAQFKQVATEALE